MLLLALLLAPARSMADAVSGTSNVRTVCSAALLQQAVEDGVRHIILTDHIDSGIFKGQLDGREEARASNALVAVQPSTRSIVVCCCGALCDMLLKSFPCSAIPPFGQYASLSIFKQLSDK
jgi:hypothetical protein